MKQNQTLEGVKVGDIFNSRSVWYGEHNEFYQVIAIKGQHSVILKRIDSVIVSGDSWYGEVKPIKNGFNDRFSQGEITKKVKIVNNRPYINFGKYETGFIVRDGETFTTLSD